jgi:SAM-dependent methyltransferase
VSTTVTVLDFLPESSEPRSVLSVGSGAQELDSWKEQGYSVVRCDIDPSTNPDIVRNMTALGNIGLFDVVFCCHALEHVYPHEVGYALHEFKRVLRKGGYVVILVPDLEGVQATTEPLYRTDCGPITGLHLIYGDPNEIPNHPHMAHHCGFVQDGLQTCLEQCGFSQVTTTRLPNYNLLGIGVKA